jgi:ankyrin repeat protein
LNPLGLLGRLVPGSRRRIAGALRAAVDGDRVRFQKILKDDPGIVYARLGNNTILEWLTQPRFSSPDPHFVEALIGAGSELNRALNLAGCWNLPEMCSQLLAAGADPTARADADITPLESAAMHSSTASADILSAHGLHRPSLWLAAATGRLDLVQDWITPQLGLRRDPGPYRPNWADVGRPAGEPSSSKAGEIIGEAFVFAALNDRFRVVERLLEMGIDVDSRPYRNTTALHFAIQFHRVAMVRFLLGRNASVAIRDDVFGAAARDWASACHDGSPAAGEILRLLETAGTD